MIEHPSAESRPIPDEPPSRQRRGSRRRPLEASVTVVHPASGTGVTINASEGGFRVAVDLPLRAEAICVLVVRVPGAPDQLVRARVAWSRVLDDGCIAGLQQLGLH
jgi:hypothetical protein